MSSAVSVQKDRKRCRSSLVRSHQSKIAQLVPTQRSDARTTTATDRKNKGETTDGVDGRTKQTVFGLGAGISTPLRLTRLEVRHGR